MPRGDRDPAALTPSWHAQNTPDVAAIVMGSTGETTTYAELEERSSRLARALRSRGLHSGDHIAIVMENNRPFLEVAWAAQRSGLRSELATYNCPRSIDFVDDLPRDDNGKLYKRLLRERYWEGHESLVI